MDIEKVRHHAIALLGEMGGTMEDVNELNLIIDKMKSNNEDESYQFMTILELLEDYFEEKIDVKYNTTAR